MRECKNTEDICQECHNALQCLEWEKSGYKAKCTNWEYFKQHYASGNKKIIGDETEGKAVSESNKYPDKCPVTYLPLFMEIEHPKLGLVPTYGGPYDSYTIPEIDEEGDFCCYRFDHDQGYWVDGVEVVGNATEIIIDLRSQLEKLESKIQNDEILRGKLTYYSYSCGHITGDKYSDSCPVCETKDMQAANGVLRGALERAMAIMAFHTYRCPINIPNNFSGSEEHLDEYREVYQKLIPEILKTTPAEAGERVQGLVEALEGITKETTAFDGEIVPTMAAIRAMQALAKYKGE